MKRYQSIKKTHAEPMAARDYMAIVYRNMAPDCGKPSIDQESLGLSAYV